MGKKHLLGMTMEELHQVVNECGLPKYSAKQISDWVYNKGVTSIEQMTNISLNNRNKLSGLYDVGRYEPIEYQQSEDGTIKYLFKTENGKFIETVMIPEEGEDRQSRYTLCVSSQVGCKMKCVFCMTGKQGFDSNLTAHEIMNQIYSVKEADKLTNIVFMGMGEPLDNYDELMKALGIIVADYAMGWSPKRITVSTTGLTPKLKSFIEDSSVHLAISLHSPLEDQRKSIMPIEHAYPMTDILDLLKEYDWSKQRRLSIEYIMFDGFNDTFLHAKVLGEKLRGLDCRVNLIRFHAIPGVTLKPSPIKKMEEFRDYLTQRRIISTIRSSRGEDISAACGMLSTEKITNRTNND